MLSYFRHPDVSTKCKMIRETGDREHLREVQGSKTEVVGTREDARSGIRRKTNTGDGTTWEKEKQRWMDYRDNNCLEENCVCRSDRTIE